MTTAAAARRTYRATLYSRAPYPLNWDSVAETFPTLEAALAQAAEWQRRYPKGLAKGGGRQVVVDSWAGVAEGDRGPHRLVGRRVHFDSKTARA